MPVPKMNHAVFEEVSKIVIGHDYAKKVLINLINRSRIRYYQKWGMLERTKLINVSNCLLVGDSGTGKTYLIETLSEIMQFPFIKIDATELNPTGASGGIKKEGLIKKIKERAEELGSKDPDLYWSVEATMDQMVVFVDEIDKLGQQLSSDWNQHVQANFLTLFENKDKYDSVTFVFAGAFMGMDKYAKKDVKQGMGFHHNHKVKDELLDQEELSSRVVKHGLLPELVGRIQNIVLLDELKEADYKKILVNTILPQAKEELSFFGVKDFKLEEEQIDDIAKRAVKSGLGVRSMKSAVHSLMVDEEFNSKLELYL